MARRVWPYALGGLALSTLAGCAWIERAERPAWRAQAENVCFARGLVKASAYVEPLSEISGPGICGMTRPLKVAALADGAVALNKALTIDCPMVAALGTWLDEVVQPIAMSRFGRRVVEVEAFGAYSCRSVDDMAGAPLSEHAFGNAVDVSGFKLADGREIVVERDWKRSDTQESAFLREAHAGACQHFTTVLGPGADVFHYNHIHLDLARHGATNAGARRYCKPAPSPNLLPPPDRPDGLPPAPDIEEPMDVARAKPGGPTTRIASAPIILPGAERPPPAPGTLDPSPIPPILPGAPDDGVDATPTSSVPIWRDD
jgi:hypothetical protein